MNSVHRNLPKLVEFFGTSTTIRHKTMVMEFISQKIK